MVRANATRGMRKAARSSITLFSVTGLKGNIFNKRIPTSELGLVSRASPVHAAMRNCTRDEGRSFEVGNQVLISSRCKLLWSKAPVVNVAEKSEQDFDRYD